MAPELVAWRVEDRAAWNSFVEAAPYAAFPQLWEWGELKAASGWQTLRICVGRPGEPLAGAQLLLRRVPLLGWRLAYVPRGPIGTLDDPAVREALVRALGELGRSERLATVRVDPETLPSEPYGTALLESPWRRARGIQAAWTRLVDLTRAHDELRADMRGKHRQYVAKAQREGIAIECLRGPDVDSPAVRSALADFHRIVSITARRTGFTMRLPSYYERAWREFAPTGNCRLYFARQDGERVATIFHFLCGRRAVETWGGMLEHAGPTRANYLVKWQAMLDLKDEGFETYDMWGIANPGIRQFKEGFGGREVRYVGARELAVSAIGDPAVRVAVAGYGSLQRLRARLRGEGAPEGLEAD
jgi:peptidoglycan pentaglycine glycine transferase (the first glycine)